MADKEEIQLAGVLVEERNHGMIRDEDLIWEVKDRKVLLASLWDRVCNLIAGAWDNFTSPHWALACTYHVLGGRFLVSRLSRWAFLWQLRLRRSINGHEWLLRIHVTGTDILRRVPVLLKVPSLRVYTLTHIYRCKGSNRLRHNWAVIHWGSLINWGFLSRGSFV